MNLNDLPQVRTIEDLRSAMTELSKEPTDDARLIWFTCVGYAEELSDANIRSIAQLFKGGIQPVGLADVQNFITAFHEGDAENGNRYLIASVARFLGLHEWARSLIEYDNVIEHEDC